jgi:uncharacterized protein YbjT (DUF2867 family)
MEGLGMIEKPNYGFWRDRPTLVTGATGLVGSWLVHRLVASGADVCAGSWLIGCAGPGDLRRATNGKRSRIFLRELFRATTRSIIWKRARIGARTVMFGSIREMPGKLTACSSIFMQN